MQLPELPERLIEDALEIEPLPDSVLRLRELFAGADWAIADAIDIVRLDGPLTARVLQVANAPAFAGRAETTTVQHAIGRLGAKMVLSIALSSAVRGSLEKALPGYGYGAGELWRRSVTCALAAEALARKTSFEAPDEAFTASLLQDLGTVLVSRYLDPALLGLLEMSRQSSESELEAERELLELHHGEIGQLVAQAWGLPEAICEAIAHHHEPEAAQAEARELTRLVWASEQIAEVLDEADADATSRLAPLGEMLGLTPDHLAEVAERVATQRDALIAA